MLKRHDKVKVLISQAEKYAQKMKATRDARPRPNVVLTPPQAFTTTHICGSVYAAIFTSSLALLQPSRAPFNSAQLKGSKSTFVANSYRYTCHLRSASAIIWSRCRYILNVAKDIIIA